MTVPSTHLCWIFFVGTFRAKKSINCVQLFCHQKTPRDPRDNESEPAYFPRAGASSNCERHNRPRTPRSILLRVARCRNKIDHGLRNATEVPRAAWTSLKRLRLPRERNCAKKQQKSPAPRKPHDSRHFSTWTIRVFYAFESETRDSTLYAMRENQTVCGSNCFRSLLSVTWLVRKNKNQLFLTNNSVVVVSKSHYILVDGT